MHWPTMVVGCLAITFSLVTVILRFFRPKALGKLEPMRQAFGRRPGTLLHWVVYTLVPLYVGIRCVQLALMGLSPWS